MKSSVRCTRPKYVCGNDRMKLIGTTDGLFPDFGHHIEGKMGGLWLYPIKLLDGFWLRLIDKEAGTVDCWTAADSFDNEPHKNTFHYNGGLGHTPVTVTRCQMIPHGTNGLIVSYEFALGERHTSARTLDLTFVMRSNLRPGWLAEEKGICDGCRDLVLDADVQNGVLIKDSDHEWYAVCGTDFAPDALETGDYYGSDLVNGSGVGIRIKKQLVIHPGDTIRMHLYVAGSADCREEALESYAAVYGKKIADFEPAERRYYEARIRQTGLQIEEPDFEEIFDWMKVHTSWLTVESPGIGRGVAAGMPEYPWWFGCDSFYALQGILLQGQFELARETIEIIWKTSELLNGNGRIIHEYMPDGVCPNPGNVQETAHFICFLWEYYIWTGDRSLLEETYDYVKRGLQWLREQDADGDYFPTGYGIIEIAGLCMEMIDTAVYTLVAMQCFCRIAATLSREADAEGMEAQIAAAEANFHAYYWNEEEGLFNDCVAPPDLIGQKEIMITDALKQSRFRGDLERFQKLFRERNTAPDKDFGWLIYKNWILNVPMETGIADGKQAERALKRLHSAEFIGPYGMYLEGTRPAPTMTISTGVMAVAQARYGYSDRALELIRKIFRTFSMATPGAISEMSPDYGCFVQAWTAYGVYVPIVRFFFGVCPDPVEKQIHIHPNLPSDWKNRTISLEHLRVLDGEISIYCSNGSVQVENYTTARLVMEE